jgi:hypothetical protein
MLQIKRHLGILLAAVLLCPLNVQAEDVRPGAVRGDASSDRREEPVRVQVNVNLFFPGPTGESDESMKLRERARRSAYELAAGECALVEQSLAKTCRLESVSVNISRQTNGQVEGYAAGSNVVLRVTLK